MEVLDVTIAFDTDSPMPDLFPPIFPPLICSPANGRRPIGPNPTARADVHTRVHLLLRLHPEQPVQKRLNREDQGCEAEIILKQIELLNGLLL